ncbi:aa3-type cytochrome c oxidase subunit IV [Pontivivens insulae]|uniref:Cytochrome c oxidase subunit 4 n=1 Tax=Pontivivens insulae TaxID=1639689 RepID=A0A2R8A7K5_9RHOB|nr:aa3-type cytochrome c oxidase subunit IV [Pontivivens insulae]RED18313.1 aa3 type cytochrome c oxidase subunit IV [Pontivivens insulae]SPF28211.1 Cytochrome c oxidase subunit 4 [Pontivivens insulae]
MADNHQEHEHGSMDITDQQKTFEGFITFGIRSTIVILIILIFLAIFRT